MATDLSQLVTEFYSFFLDLYHHKTRPPAGAQPDGQTAQTAQPTPEAMPPSAFIAFEGIGVPITPEMFKLQSGEFDPGLVMQQFTLYANMIPVIDGTSILAPGLLTADRAYELMLEEAQPLTALDLEAFGFIKNSAQKTLQNAEGNYSIPGLNGEFHPIVPNPPDWPLPSGAAVWTPCSFEQSETVATAPPPPPRSVVTPVPNTPLGMPGMPFGIINA